jgi:hypothetical protein
VLVLRAIILKVSKDHEAAVQVGEGIPILGRCPLVLVRLLVEVPALALAGLT